MNKLKFVLVLLAATCIAILSLTACSPDEPTQEPSQNAPVPTGTPSATATLNPTQRYQSTLQANQTQNAIHEMTRAATATARALTPAATTAPQPPGWTGLSLDELASLGKGTLPQIVYSQDGSRIYTSDGFHVEVLDSATREMLSSFEISEDGYSGIVSISPDGNLIVVDFWSGFSVLNADTGEEIARGSGGNGVALGPVFTGDSRFVVYRRADRSSGGPYHAICLLNLHSDEAVEVPANEYEGQCYPEPDPFNYHTYTDPAVSPDGKWVAAGYADWNHESLFIWNLADGTVLHEIVEQPARIYSVAFSPDGSLLASAGADGLVRLWNPLTGTIHRTIAAFTDTIYRAAFTPDGKQLIVEVRDQLPVYYTLNTGITSPVPVPTLDPLSREMLVEGYLQTGGGSKLRFSADGTRVAVGHGSLQVWDPSSSSLVSALFTDEPLQIAGLTFSPDGSRLAVVTVDGNVYAWDASSGESLFEITAGALLDVQVLAAYGGGPIGPGIGAGVFGEKGIGFSPDGRLLALANGPGVEVWEIESGSRSLMLEQTSPVMYPTRISFSDDGAFIYAAMNRNIDLAVWDAATGELLRQMDLPWVDPNAFSATDMQGDLFARNNYDDTGYWIEVWNIRSGEMLRLPTHLRQVEPLRFSPDGKYLAAIAGYRIYVWSTTTGDLLFVSAEGVELGDFAIGPNGGLLATADYGVVTLWDFSPRAAAAAEPDFDPLPPPPTSTPWSSSSFTPRTPTPQPTLALTPLPVPALHTASLDARKAPKIMLLGEIGNGVVSRIRWSADGENVFVAAATGMYRLLPESLSQTADYRLASLWVTDGRGLPDGRVLLAGRTPNGTVQVWEMTSGQMIVELPGYGVPAISPDGRRLVFENDGGLAVWDLEQGEARASLLSVFDLSWPVFSPDGRFVAAVQSDWSVRVWDAETGIIVNGVGGVQAEITDLSFSPSGAYLVGAGGGTAWVWSISPSLPSLKVQLFEGRPDGNLLLFDDRVTSAAIDPDDSLLAVGTSDRKIWLYDLETGAVRTNLGGLASAPARLAFSPDGTRLLSADADGQLVTWDVPGEKALAVTHEFGGLVQGLVSLLDGGYAAFQQNTIRTFDPDAAAWLQTSYIPTDRILAVSPAGDLAAGYEPFQVTLFDALNGDPVQTLLEEAEDVFIEHYWEGSIIRQFYGALFSPDGSRLATFGTGGVWFYAGPDFTLLGQTEINHNTRKAAFSPDGEWLLASPFENTWSPGLIAVESAEIQMIVGQLSEQGDYGDGLAYGAYAFSPDGRMVAMTRAAYREAASVELVDIATGELIARISFEDGRPVPLAFSPAGNLLAVGLVDGRVAMIDLDTLQVVSEFQAHLGWISSLLFSQDGRLLITAGADGIVKIWGALDK